MPIRIVVKNWLLCSLLLGLPLASADAPQVRERTDLVDVQVPREFRGLWVASVSNLDFPHATGSDAQRQELVAMVSRAKALGFNALVFQVRPEGDALYDSELEPWSRFLTGTQGQDPGYDPLQVLIHAAHGQGLQVHAWFNPYRAASLRTAPTHERHVSHWASGSAMRWGHQLWLDPGASDVQDHAVAVITDVLDRYDVDGIHMDDYFYPYPRGGQPFPDDATYERYLASGGTLQVEDWRRANVDGLVQSISDVVRERHPQVQFGISPFGIYRNGVPEGVRGMDQVSAIYADPMKWYDEGWVDYLAPQLYWSTQRERQPYARLLSWWDGEMSADRPLFAGLDCTRVGRDDEWTLDEFRTQVQLTRDASRTAGQIWFRATPVLSGQAGLDELAMELYPSPAVPPAIARHSAALTVPSVRIEHNTVALNHTRRSDLQAFVVYEQHDGNWLARRVLGAHTRAIALPTQGIWAVSAVSRAGHETAAVRIPSGALHGDG